MDLLDGTTGFDRVMAVLTILGFLGTGFGLFQAWHQAKRATTAAEAARTAVTTTRSRLVTVDLMNEFAAVRQAAGHVETATETDNVEVAKFALVQLADAMRRGVTLARDDGSPSVDPELIKMLDSMSKLASSAKAELAKRKNPKVRTHTGALLPTLTDLSHSLLDIETTQKYVLNEES